MHTPTITHLKKTPREFVQASYPYSRREVGKLQDSPAVFRRPLLRDDDMTSYFGILVHVSCDGCASGYNFQLRILDTVGIGQPSMIELTRIIARRLAVNDLLDQGMPREEAEQRIHVRLLDTAYRSAARMERAAFSHYLTSEEAMAWAANLTLRATAEAPKPLSFLTSIMGHMQQTPGAVATLP